jgi:hypothetical protein
MNIDSINNEEGRHYVQTWIKALEVLLNWSQEQTLEWAQKWQTGLNDRQPGFFNDTPGRYLLPLLIPPNIKEGLSGNEAAHLKENQDSFCYRKSDFDWRLVKTKIAVFFGKLEEQKRTSKKNIKGFLLDYQRLHLPKKPTKRHRELLRKTHIPKKSP